MLDVQQLKCRSGRLRSLFADGRYSTGAKWLASVGLALLASGAGHLVVWMLDGGSLAGPVSWRKPILFGISGGLTALSLAWVTTLLKPAKRDGGRRIFSNDLLGTLAAGCLLAEVALITIQIWRGQPAHFYSATRLDAFVLGITNGLILAVTVIILELTRRTFDSIEAVPSMRLAARGGMVLLSAACLLGVLIAAYGERQVRSGGSPELFGEAGVLKFAHGMPLHAIQWLPLTAWAMRRLGGDERRCFGAVRWSLLGLTGVSLFALMQTFTGRGRFDVTPESLVVLLASVVCLALPWAVTASDLIRQGAGQGGRPSRRLSSRRLSSRRLSSRRLRS